MDGVKDTWIVKQLEIKNQISDKDCSLIRTEDEHWKYVGGLDISFIVGDDVNACACYVILDRDLQVVYKNVKMVQMTAPYIPGFLAFREADSLLQLIDQQKTQSPQLTPDVLIVDGNGVLHPRQCGIACHIGVETGIPSIGVAKNLHQIQELGDDFSRESVKRRFNDLSHDSQVLNLKTSEVIKIY